MLTLNRIREERDEIIKRLLVKNFDATEIIERVISIDKERRETKQKSDSLQAEMNLLSKEIGKLFGQGKQQEANRVKEATGKVKDEIKELGAKLAELEKSLNEELVQIPNIPHKSVTPGKGEEDNVLVAEGGTLPEMKDDALPHWDLAKKHDLIDFELGTKLTGAGFPVYKGKSAKLQRALINFFLDEGEKAGFNEVLPPIIVNEDSGFATGQLPDKEGQMYHVGLDNFYLIPTAEVPITNIYRDLILDAEQLPIKNIGYTPCFRREAGSWGAHVRGLNRLHQFDKVEIVVISHPEKSYEMLDMMVKHVEGLVSSLDLPYRIMRLCGGDISFTSSLTYDFEVYSAAQKRWLEVSSVSNFEAFQSNRLKCRFKEKGEKQTQLVHTLNGSALALPRIVAALMENNQSDKGIRIPKVLVPYTGFEYI
ncbi:MAG: serine--tRNA ligase [Marinilabiliaceae bacterium]|jgi:seryl-tRNA synthetase|nr:serine--tRNA ligase [Marinilabiliaceae bacterium]